MDKEADFMQISVTSPINIALIKYWGKRDSKLMLPLNDSLSIAINALFAKTTITARKSEFQKHSDSVKVNGKDMDLTGSENRYKKCFTEIRKSSRKRKLENGTPEEWDFQVKSTTNFPVSAGLASSAAGFAALAFGLGKLFALDLTEIARVARIGSGSACRSVFEGFVHWRAGTESDGSDCNCQIFRGREHWRNLRAVIAVTSNQAKPVGSTDGMQRSVDTSALYQTRVQTSVPARIQDLEQAIEAKDFHKFGEIVMRDSNQLHAVCMDTWPPLMYLNDASRHLIRLVTAYNKIGGKIRVAYTFDAGPNCCMILEEETLKDFLPYLCFYCKPHPFSGSHEKFILGLDEEKILMGANEMAHPLEGVEVMHNSVQYFVVSEVGGGPTVVKSNTT